MFRDLKEVNKGSSTLEYIILITFILFALVTAQHFIVRGLEGRWKAAADTFGYGRQYDPRAFGTLGERGGTLECYFDYTHCVPGFNQPAPPCVTINQWTNRRCFEEFCDCTIPTDSFLPSFELRCLFCIQNFCYEPLCES